MVVYLHSGTAGIAEPFHAADLARRYPGINFLMLHGGASDYYGDAVQVASATDNIWLESSRNGPANYQLFHVRGITNKLVFGSSSPEYEPEVEIGVMRDTLQDEAELAGILRGNAETLFRGKL